MYEMTIFIHYVLNPVAYVLITSELPRLSYLQKRKKAYTRTVVFVLYTSSGLDTGTILHSTLKIPEYLSRQRDR